MHTSMNTPPRSLHDAWGGFRAPQAGAYPVKSMWKDTVLVTNADGNEECFAIGPDGYVWSYETGGHGQGAGRLISTGLPAQAFGLGVTGPGLLVVLAVESGMLRCAMETYDAAHRWSAPLTVAFPGQEEAPDVEKVITQTRGENLFIGFIIRLRNADGSVSRFLWEAVWAGSCPVLATAPVTLARGHAFWQDQLASPGMEMN